MRGRKSGRGRELKEKSQKRTAKNGTQTQPRRKSPSSCQSNKEQKIPVQEIKKKVRIRKREGKERETNRKGREGKGREGKGKEGKGKERKGKSGKKEEKKKKT